MPQSRRKAPPKKPFPVIAVVVAGIVALGVLAIVLSRGESGGPTTPQVASVTIDGQALPVLAGQADGAAGRPAPEIRGETFDGSPVAITDDGRPKVVFVLAHWCPHCQREVPVIVDWLEGGGRPQGVDLYSISTSVAEERGNYPPSRWLDREEWAIPVLLDDSESSAANALGLSGFPFFVVIDAEGNVVLRASGELGADQLDALVDLARQGAAPG